MDSIAPLGLLNKSNDFIGYISCINFLKRRMAAIIRINSIHECQNTYNNKL